MTNIEKMAIGRIEAIADDLVSLTYTRPEDMGLVSESGTVANKISSGLREISSWAEALRKNQ
jgi:hypothetical protein